MRRQILYTAAIVSALWLACVWVANPRGDFPLNDDWNYGVAVRDLLVSGRLTVTCWTLAASVPHVLYGWLACLPGGFSFETLRASTCLSAVAGLFAVAGLLGVLGVGAPLLAVVLLTLAFNPLFFALSQTFMTDVPAFCLTALCLVVLTCRLLAPAPQALKADIPGVLAVVALCLTRQTAVVLPLAFAVAFVVRHGRSARTLVSALAPLAAAVAAVVWFQLWLSAQPGPLFSYRVEEAWLSERFSQGLLTLSAEAAANLLRIAVYLGLFLAPVSLWTAPAVWRRLDGRQRVFHLVLAAEFALLLAALLVMKGAQMPLADNILIDWGVGPLLTTRAAPEPAWPTAPAGFWLSVTAAGVGFAALLVTQAVALCFAVGRRLQGGQAPAGDHAACFFALTAVLYLGVVCLRGFFDRYLLFPLLLAAAAFAVLSAGDADQRAGARTLAARAAAGLIVLALAYFSVAAGHDYLSWNRARWQALAYLVGGAGASPLDVDGGLEFNGWTAYAPGAPDSAIVFDTNMTHGDKFALAYAPAPGYDVLGRFAFARWLPPGRGEIVALKKR